MILWHIIYWLDPDIPNTTFPEAAIGVREGWVGGLEWVILGPNWLAYQHSAIAHGPLNNVVQVQLMVNDQMSGKKSLQMVKGFKQPLYMRVLYKRNIITHTLNHPSNKSPNN